MTYQKRRKPAHPEDPEIMKAVYHYQNKVQVMLRVDIDKLEALRKKLREDGMKRQRIWEKFVDLYLEDNKQIMALLEPCKKISPSNRLVTDKDLQKIEKQLELESPLQDLVINTDDPLDND